MLKKLKNSKSYNPLLIHFFLVYLLLFKSCYFFKFCFVGFHAFGFLDVDLRTSHLKNFLIFLFVFGFFGLSVHESIYIAHSDGVFLL